MKKDLVIRGRVCAFRGAGDSRIGIYREIVFSDVAGICTHISQGALIAQRTREEGRGGDKGGTQEEGTEFVVTAEHVAVLAWFLPIVEGPYLPATLPKHLWAHCAEYVWLPEVPIPDSLKPEWFVQGKDEKDAWAREHMPKVSA